jgi:hypothetical protein
VAAATEVATSAATTGAATTGATTETADTSLEDFADLTGDAALAETEEEEGVGSTAFAVVVFVVDFFATVLLILILSEVLEGISKRGMLLQYGF